MTRDAVSREAKANRNERHTVQQLRLDQSNVGARDEEDVFRLVSVELHTRSRRRRTDRM